ncbi:LacI family DNA-binding transcriptional regulator [Tessaracoccus sp. MC1865]|nr:LacI family DNA-binding transcriptional regulator [Tessaracoccus sp. MC1865]MBB1482427.1 LacI family DNA-binding transcriptional regulator [Tessaracoccus sp. MC1865]QTO38835.1 LacI family DNA-binding transcriptional regulator [Tessaracoccus sp. MC1865]
MRDVADLAKVSLGTVSNVVNNPDKVLPDTRRRVEDAIRELGWIPNQMARELRAGRSQTIGLAVMDVTNPFFADLLRAAQSRLESEGYYSTIGDADNRTDREKALLRSFRDQRVGGVILGPIESIPTEVAELRRAGIPTVLVDRVNGGEHCTAGVDDVEGGAIAGRHLIGQGHRRLAFVGGPGMLTQVRRRHEGISGAAADAGAELLVIPTPEFSFAAGRDAADNLADIPAERRPTGVFCANDVLAVGLLQGLVARQLRVPDDVAIIGYDDIEFAAAAAVPLSSVAQPRRELGRAAADLLLEEIGDRKAGRSHEHREMVFTPTLVVRASSAVPR